MVSRLSPVTALVLVAGLAQAQPQSPNNYTNTVLVASDGSYEPLRFVDPLLLNGWGIALRPPDAGGHFWISNAGSGTTTTYIGDVHDASGRFTPLTQDSLTVVNIGQAAAVTATGDHYLPSPTGQVYNYSTTDFVVSGEGITAASKFIFVTAEGTVSGWTQVRDAQNVLHNQSVSVVMVDNSGWYNGEQLLYTGCAVTDFASNNRLYVTNTALSRVEVFDHEFHPISIGAGKFEIPQPPISRLLQPWNVQYFHSGPNGEGRLWISFVELEDPWEEEASMGAVAEFDLEGNFIRRVVTNDILNADESHPSELRAPWGIAFAPANFGPLSNALLIANFTDGTIPAFNPQTLEFIDYLRGPDGEPVVADGVWGITFGNGVGLGDSNALYYAAGPNGEEDGSFGTIRYTPDTCPHIQDQPAAAAAAPGGEAVFTVNAPCPTRTQTRWEIRRSGGEWTVLADGAVGELGTVSGATTAQLHVEQVSCGAAAQVRAVISNTCGSVTSTAVSLGVLTADVGSQGGVPGGDGVTDNNDFVVFIGRFFNQENAADVGHQGGLAGPDGRFDNNDFVAFIDLFFTGC